VGVAGSPNPIRGIVGAHELFHCASLVGTWFFWHFIGEVARTPPIGQAVAIGSSRADPISKGRRPRAGECHLGPEHGPGCYNRARPHHYRRILQ